MKKGNISIGIAIAIAMTAVLAISGCVEEVGDIAEDISEIGSREYQITFIKGEKRPVAVDSEYSVLLKEVRTTIEGEVVVEIFSGNISIGQRTLTTGFGRGMRIERLTLELVSVDRGVEYAEIKISEKIDIVGHGEKVAGAVGKIAESVAKSQT
jgi:hypothetical protein